MIIEHTQFECNKAKFRCQKSILFFSTNKRNHKFKITSKFFTRKKETQIRNEHCFFLIQINLNMKR
jgi:hypothetical protein